MKASVILNKEQIVRLKAMLTIAGKATQGRYALTQVHIEVRPQQITFITADGFNLAAMQVPADTAEDSEFHLNVSAVGFKKLLPRDKGVLEVDPEGVSLADVRLQSVVCSFPHWRQVLPKSEEPSQNSAIFSNQIVAAFFQFYGGRDYNRRTWPVQIMRYSIHDKDDGPHVWTWEAKNGSEEPTRHLYLAMPMYRDERTLQMSRGLTGWRLAMTG